MHKLPELPYSYSALEPHIDARTMEIHHSKHHQGYIDKLNKALEQYPDWQGKTVEDLLRNLHKIPQEIRKTIQNNGGGHLNHSLFWQIMSPDGGGEPGGDLSKAINKDFNSFAKFRDEFSNAALGIFGSGWAWLTLEGQKLESRSWKPETKSQKPEARNQKLKIVVTSNQDSPLSQGLTSLLGLDVWEHAYYLKHQNRRVDYINAWWNVVNWEEVGKNL